MFTRLSRSWQLTQQSFAVLMQDKELLLFPVLSVFLTVLLLASFFVPAAFMVDWHHHVERMGRHGELDPAQTAVGFIVAFAAYFLVYTAMLFCNTAMLFCARKRFEGGDPTFADGIRAGLANLGHIFAWAALSATVGVILQALEERLGFLGALLRSFLGAAWSVISFFALPVMIFEGVGPRDAMKRAGEILKRTWGEALGAYVGLSAVHGLLSFLALLPLGATIYLALSTDRLALMGWGIGLALVWWIGLAIVFASLSQIFCAALYQYAASGEVPAGYDQDTMREAFRTRQGNRFL